MYFKIVNIATMLNIVKVIAISNKKQEKSYIYISRVVVDLALLAIKQAIV